MKVIITDCDHENIEIEEEILSKDGIEYSLSQCKTEEDLIEQCMDANILINQYAPISERVMRELKALKLVVRYGVGVDNIDVEAATKLGIQICNVPDYGMNEVADHAIGLIMALSRKIITMNQYTKNMAWDYRKAIPIHRNSSMTVGVVGLGRIGRNFAKKVHGLGYNVIGYDIYYQPNSEDGTDYITKVDFNKLVSESDIISIHCPLDGSENLFDYETFKAMKDSAYIVNVARGGIINEGDLDRALDEGLIAGAALDCMEKEPMDANSKIFRHENLIVTPHMAWYSEEAARELKAKVAQQVIKFIKEGKVSYPVNEI